MAHERLEHVQTKIIVGRWHDDEHHVSPCGSGPHFSDDVGEEDLSDDAVRRQVHPDEDALDSCSEVRPQEGAKLNTRASLREWRTIIPGTLSINPGSHNDHPGGSSHDGTNERRTSTEVVAGWVLTPKASAKRLALVPPTTMVSSVCRDAPSKVARTSSATRTFRADFSGLTVMAHFSGTRLASTKA